MMYIHYCRHCQRIHILNGHKTYCPRCKGHLTELRISYIKYVNLDRQERQTLREHCKNPGELLLLSAAYSRTQEYARWLSLPVSNVENYHTGHYAAYSQ